MMKKTTKIMVNGVLLAALAAIGITVYQLGSSPATEKSFPEDFVVEEAKVEETPAPQEDAEADSSSAAAAINAEVKPEAEADPVASVDMESVTEEQEETKDTAGDVLAEAAVQPALDFSEDTDMEWPVNGNILLDYDMEQTTYFPTLDQYKLSPAIAVQAVEGAPVVAAANGSVYAVENNARTGNTVTMELGNGYQAVYGQLTDLTVEEGDLVEKGDIIGYIAAPTKYYSKEGSNLYFAMRRNSLPIDPIVYLP